MNTDTTNTAASSPELPDFALVVLTGGFVYAGKPRINEGYRYLSDAKCVRRWGTSRGLGQLASEGIQPDTVLDTCPDLLVPLHAMIHLMSCKPI